MIEESSILQTLQNSDIQLFIAELRGMNAVQKLEIQGLRSDLEQLQRRYDKLEQENTHLILENKTFKNLPQKPKISPSQMNKDEIDKGTTPKVAYQQIVPQIVQQNPLIKITRRVQKNRI